MAEVGERTTGVLEGAPWVDEVWARPKHQGLAGKVMNISRMRAAGFDLAVIFDDSNPHVLHARLAGIPLRVGVWRGRRYEGAYSCAAPYRTDRCETRENFADLLGRIGAQSIDVRPELAVGQHHVETADGKLRDHGWSGNTPLIGLHPGASLPEKRWAIEKFAAVAGGARSQGWQPVIVGGPDDRERGLEIRSLHPEAIDLTGKTTILELAAVCRRLKALVTNDTGALHVAASQGTRCIALYGPTDPVAFSPWGVGHSVVVGKCACRPKSEASCNAGCMAAIDTQQVMGCLMEVA
ncbi:MAG: hypothetical protein HONBIEJF_02498 [Fimbriimonadaceae bacterium]|nr:hypothetical protein [Fimbriimonadaceae bacterium]